MFYYLLHKVSCRAPKRKRKKYMQNYFHFRTNYKCNTETLTEPVTYTNKNVVRAENNELKIV